MDNTRYCSGSTKHAAYMGAGPSGMSGRDEAIGARRAASSVAERGRCAPKRRSLTRRDGWSPGEGGHGALDHDAVHGHRRERLSAAECFRAPIADATRLAATGE